MELNKQERINQTIEIIVVVLMGLTALLTAWATWIGSLHGGNQATNYTMSNNIAAEGNSEYNAGAQTMMQDMLLWNEISDMQMDFLFAMDQEDQSSMEQIAYKLYFKMNENLSENMAQAIGWSFPDGDPLTEISLWLDQENSTTTPFSEESFYDQYVETANELLSESTEVLEQGKKDNSNGDAFGLVTVIYSVSLFLLGMVSTMKGINTKYSMLGIAVVLLLFGVIYMLTIPLPTGFSIMSFFGG